jgi:hypothetical protein
VGDFPNHLVSATRPGFGRVRAGLVMAALTALCLTLAGGAAVPSLSGPAFLIAGMSEIPSPPQGTSWAPAPIESNGLRMVAGVDGRQFVLHTADGERTFLPGVDLGGSTPGGAPISAAQYRAWFAAMSWLGIRVVRIYDIHPPALYQQLAAFNQENPDRPLYLVQGVSLPDQSYIGKRNLYDDGVTKAFQHELDDAAKAVAGQLTRSGSAWDTDVNPWLAGWLIGSELDPQAGQASDQRNAGAKPTQGKYFRNTDGSTPTERWLAARMEELAEAQAKRGVSQPIAFVNWPTTDPLRHPEEPLAQEDLLQLDANHVRPTAAWPAGTFAAYHAYPYYPDFLRYEPGLVNYQYDGRSDPYAGYLAALRDHHATMPTMIAEFGVPSSIGSAHYGPLDRSQGEHSEQDAMRIDGELLRMIADQGLAGGFLFSWMDDWSRFTWNTVGHQDAARRSLWHDPLTNEQYFGLLAMDPAGRDDSSRILLDSDEGWPGRRVTGRTDESFLHLTIDLAGSPPGSLLVGFDVLPAVTGAPMVGSVDRRPDAIFALNLVGHTGQAYLRNKFDPLALDLAIPASARASAPDGWKAFELIANRGQTIPTTQTKQPTEMQNAGQLRHGEWLPTAADADSRALWHLAGDRLDVRVPWAMLGFADPSAHRVAVPQKGKLTTQVSPGVSVSLSASGTEQAVGQVTWADWGRPGYVERLKQGAEQFRDAALAATTG